MKLKLKSLPIDRNQDRTKTADSFPTGRSALNSQRASANQGNVKRTRRDAKRKLPTSAWKVRLNRRGHV